MANPGVGSRFVSVNLNKSYGQPSNKPNQSSGANRGWSSGHAAGGGMVVLSRPRSSQKPGPKLSVPSPLNLPSLRKEHERFDLLGAGVGQGTVGGFSGGPRSASSGAGWAKPGNVSLSENKDGDGSSLGVSRGSSAYAQATRTATVSDTVPNQGNVLVKGVRPLNRSMVLRGEDFPSLHAALPASEKHDNAKHKHAIGDGLVYEQKMFDRSSAVTHVNSEIKTFPYGSGKGSNVESDYGSKERMTKSDYLSGPFSSVILNPRSDWADDERDTSHGSMSIRSIKSHDQERGFLRGSVIPQKPVHNLFNKWVDYDGERGKFDERGKFVSAEPPKMGHYATEVTLSRDRGEGKSWRSSHFSHDVSTVRDDTLGRTSLSYCHGKGRKEMGYVGGEQHDSYGEKEQYGRYGGHASEISPITKKSLSSVSSTSVKPYLSDPLSKSIVDDAIDGRNSLSPGRLGAVKLKKKDLVSEPDFYDPVRESFEAELERVQKMQEEERQRIIEEQERAIELARREEEERIRMAREHEERQRQLEQEAREAAWRAEQEHSEAIQRAEEQRAAREEEKQRVLMEEERRKESAKLKLLELEAKIAKRQAEEAKSNGITAVAAGNMSVKGKSLSKAADLEDWENGERIPERITTSSSSDSSFMNRTLEGVTTTRFSRDGSAVPDGRKPFSSWKKDSSNSQGQGNYHHVYGRTFSKREVSGGNMMSNGYNNEKELERYDEKFNTGQWEQDCFPHHPSSFYPDHSMGSDMDEGTLYSLSRSRYSIRQPRVLPPPSRPIANRAPMLQHSAEDIREESETAILSNHEDVQVNSEVMVSNGRATSMSESQSSVSASSLPDSPEHVSHDDLDESSARQSRDIPFVENNPLMLLNDTEVSEKFQEQEEYDEDAVAYQEDDDVQEADDPNEVLTRDFGEICLEKESPIDEGENTVLGFNEGVEVSMPSDELDNISKDNLHFSTPLVSTENIELQTIVNEEARDEKTPGVSSSSHPDNLGMNLQFGLFSGPPFPAIQIGSIQLPIQLHHPFSPTATQMHASPAPYFQFGQVRYTPTTTPGILSLHPQSVPSVSHIHPSKPSTNQPVLDGLPPSKIESESVLRVEDPALKSSKGAAGNNKGRGPTSRAAANGAVPVFNSKPVARRGMRFDSRRVRPQYPAPTTAERFFPFKKPQMFPRRRNMPRTEFRVRANFNKQQATDSIQSAPSIADTKTEHEKGSSGSTSQKQEVNRNGSTTSGRMLNKENKREAPKVKTTTNIGARSLKRNLHYEVDVEAPLQRGIVRIFEQRGIEVPSDEDDFIEVRSKRQMLNDRRVRKEKEIMAKSKVPKPAPKAHPARKGAIVMSSSSVLPSIEGADMTAKEEQSVVVSSGLDDAAVPDTLGSSFISHSHPSADAQSENAKGLQQSCADEDHKPEKNESVNSAQTYQQVIPLTQSQLDEAMKAEKFDGVNECKASTSSIFVNDRSSSSPVNSLLAGERIQFGAVTSPTVLPPGSCAITNRTEVHESGVLEDREAEAEAAASAVAAAAISSEETVGNGLGTSIVSDTTVTLPADLSIETLPISPWPPALAHPSSSPHFPVVPPRMPFYDLNPVLTPVFAFGPQEDAARTQQPAQLGPGLLGPWQHHPRAESYGHPGFTGQFIAPPGGFPAPPHMVLYNHFAPIGQFGQVGMSFLGTAYISSGKPNEWKHASEGKMVNNDVSGQDSLSNPPGRMQDVPPMFVPSAFQAPSSGPGQAHWAQAHISTSPAVISVTSPTVQRQEELHRTENSPLNETVSSLMDPGPAQLSEKLGLLDPLSSGHPTTRIQRSSIPAPRSPSNQAKMGFNGGTRYARTDFNQRGGGGYTQKINSGSEWGRGRAAFVGRSRPAGVEKNFPPARMKQIYVVKHTICSESRVA